MSATAIKAAALKTWSVKIFSFYFSYYILGDIMM